jgi:hypothetical protein
MGRKSDPFVLSGTGATTSTIFPVSVRHNCSDQGHPPMRRYLLVTTLSFTSIAALTAIVQAAPPGSAEPAMRVAQAPEGTPPPANEPPAEPEDRKRGRGPEDNKEGAPPPAPQNAPPLEQQERQGRRERGGDEGPRREHNRDNAGGG